MMLPAMRSFAWIMTYTSLGIVFANVAVSDEPTRNQSAATESRDLLWCNTVSGVANATPAGYVPPLVSNGSLSMLVDYLGGQTQRAYVRETPCIWWAGRRYDPPASRLIPFGHFEHELVVNGEPCATPTAWTQTLDTKTAVVACRNEYANGLVVETTVFTPLDHDFVVLKRRLTTK